MLIKRYPNRKLYNTVSRHYVSLADLAVYLRQGEDVQVIDHPSGDDITAVTLAQVISGQERRRRGLFPGHLLAELFQAGNETAERLRQALDWPVALDEEIRRRVAILVDQGELQADEGERWLEKLLTVPPDPSLPGLGTFVERILADRGIPTRREILALNEQLDDLLKQLDDES